MSLEELISNPAVQGALVPFFVALIAAGVLRNTRLAGLVIVAGVCGMVTLAIGWSFESMGSTRKLSLVLLGSAALVLACDALRPEWRKQALGACVVLVGAAVLWVAFGVIRQMESGAWLAALAVLGFAAALSGSAAAATDEPVRATSAAMCIGLGAGGLGLLGASAVLALFGIAVGASAGALLLVQMVRGKAVPESGTLTVPATAVAAGVAVMAVLTGGLSWYLPLALLAVPWFARLVPREQHPVWREAILASLLAVVPVALMLCLAWFMKAPSAY